MSDFRGQVLRRVLPLLLGAALFAAGLYALYHLLHEVKFSEIVAQVRAMPLSALGAALAATVVGYAALIFYDWFALRFIGHRLAPGVVALGGFLGYAFGNTIGVSAVSGGAVRYRIYSAVGLNAFEVAAVSGYVAVALGTGLTLAGLAALAIHPGAVAAYLPYPPGTVSAVAAALVIVSLTFLFWVSATGRGLRIRGVTLRLPPPGDLLGQVGVTLVDVAAAAFALWILLPAGKPDFTTFIAVYAAATMIGVLSHVPGGVGVFETVVIGTLPASVPVGEAAAALLLFRLIYYLLPFGLGFLVVGLNEARAAGGLIGRLMARLPAPVQPGLAALHGVAPALVAVVAFGFGAYLMLVTMIPAVRSDAMAEGDLVAELLLEGGTLATAAAGVVLMILSHGLVRRVSSAYWITVLTVLGGAAAALLNGFDLENAALLLLLAVSLLPFRRAFDRHGPLTQGVFEARWFAMIGAVAVATAAFFFFAHRAVPYSNDLWAEFARGSDTPRALRAGLAASAALFFFCLYLLTRPARRKPPIETDAQALARARELAASGADPQAWLSQTGDKRFLFSDSGNAFIMYGVQRGSWVAFGDPVGEAGEFEALCWAFSDLAGKANCRAIFYEISGRNLPLWVELGFALNKVGEEAVVQLSEFSLQGRKFKTMRAAMNKREREGYAFEVLRAPHDAALMTRLGEISAAWMGEKTGREKGFSVGRFDADYLQLFDIATVRKEGQIVAFANVMVAAGGASAGVDLMRYLPEEASGLMEYMFLHLIEHFRAAGAQEFSLGMAPLAGLSERSVARSWNRFGRLIFRHGGAFYNFEGLRAFKQKFQPEWRPRYIALPPNVSPLVAMGDVALLIAGTPRGLIGK
ncbi:MAG: bifunctional lysylphosphatidylglycerol flippase/synthetase MprF [Paracoccaceae bacterium]